MSDMFYGGKMAWLREILESPHGAQFWGVRQEGVLQQGMEEASRRRKEKEEASHVDPVKDKDSTSTDSTQASRKRVREQGNSPRSETIQGEKIQVEEEQGNSPWPERERKKIRVEEYSQPQPPPLPRPETERKKIQVRALLRPEWKKIQVEEYSQPQPSRRSKVHEYWDSWDTASSRKEEDSSTWISDGCGEWRPRSAFRIAPYYRNPDPEAPQYFDDMAVYYLEAARRLPIAQMPKLAGFLSWGGLLFGLNDPVTNIIINTIYLMGKFRTSDVLPKGVDPVRHAADKASYVGVARRSRATLVLFMTFYFRHLTQAEAKRYLHAAGHDLALAVGLVEFHRSGGGNLMYSELFRELSPDCARTKAALQYAASAAMLLYDPDDLMRLLVSRFPSHLLDPLLRDLCGGIKISDKGGPVLDKIYRGEQLSAGRVSDILNLLQHPWSPSPSPSPPPPAPTPDTFQDADGNVTMIVKIGQDLFSTTTIPRDRIAAFKNGEGKENGDIVTRTTLSMHRSGHGDHARDDLEGTAYLSSDLSREGRFHSFLLHQATQEKKLDTNSLRMCLLDIIHGFYIQALAMLPSDHQPRLLRAVLEAGHCYGIMENPVHNIIINSIWYNLCYPSPNDETIQILPRSMTRVASCSLNGLMVLKRTDKGGNTRTDQEILLDLLECHVNTRVTVRKFHFLAAAAEAAKHPQPVCLMKLINGLFLHKDHLHELIDFKNVISNSDLDVISNIIARVTKLLPRNLDLCQPALMDPGCCVQAYVRTKLEEALLKYCRKDLSGPQYKLGIIFGVASKICSSYNIGTACYHANFLASTGDVPASSPSCRLFFAEFWNQEDKNFEQSKMPPDCWPVPHQNIKYHCRCFICESSAIRVVHPFDVNYFMGHEFSTDSLCAVAEHEVAVAWK